MVGVVMIAGDGQPVPQHHAKEFVPWPKLTFTKILLKLSTRHDADPPNVKSALQQRVSPSDFPSRMMSLRLRPYLSSSRLSDHTVGSGSPPAKLKAQGGRIDLGRRSVQRETNKVGHGYWSYCTARDSRIPARRTGLNLPMELLAASRVVSIFERFSNGTSQRIRNSCPSGKMLSPFPIDG